MFNSIHESGLYSVEDKEVNMREMAFADSLDELTASSTTNGPQLSGGCYNRVYYLYSNFHYIYVCQNQAWGQILDYLYLSIVLREYLCFLLKYYFILAGVLVLILKYHSEYLVPCLTQNIRILYMFFLLIHTLPYSKMDIN